jgi:Flp pilus assembly protein TadG
MQTTQRLTRKQLNAQMQQAVAQYLQRNTVKVCKAAASSTKQQRSKHIGKNCATRAGARV